MAWNLKQVRPDWQMLSNTAEIGPFRGKEDMGKIPHMRNNSQPRVLVVDDEALIRWTLNESLRERGYHVTEAGDGRGALAAIARAPDPFDVIVLDFRLPDSADLRLLERVRGMTPTAQVILMTAHNSSELTQGAEALGAYRVVSKPFEVESIAALVKQASDESPKGG
jgi:DNA-binding NtrC family response regulator